jgi:FKBP-type peptidyl-prolyl cis-trans isomerase FkpA
MLQQPHTGALVRGLFLVACIFMVGCADDPQPSRATRHIKMTDDTLVNINRKVVKTESQEIDDFLERYRWKVQTTSTGLRYMVYHASDGQKPQRGEKVVLRYKLQLLNGELLYNSANEGPREFIIGTGSVDNGLEEGVLLMGKGDKAKLIVPSHLAYGLLGDLKKIPERAVLVYDVELVSVSTPKMRIKP